MLAGIMGTNPSDFQHAEYVEVPFVPSDSTRLREAAIRKEQLREANLFQGIENAAALDSTPNFFLRGLAGGLVGAMIGAVIYALFVGFTGITLGYLAILVGFLVGKAMTLCSDERGGTAYQIAAVVLTYLAVAAAHSMLLWHFASSRPGILVAAAIYGLTFPVMKFAVSPGHGVIGLVILFVGLRAAWRMTSGEPGASRHPFRRR
jgi:hypothetical protein